MTSGILLEINTGDRYGKLTVEREVAFVKYHKRTVVCRCECGKSITTLIASLRSGNTTSCGCVQKEAASRNGKTVGVKTHFRKTHGMTKTSEYGIWGAMKKRCQDPKVINWKYYGGRGILLDPRWEKFSNFYDDMGSRPSREHTLDRIDPDGNYTKENCRWADRITQSRNKRCTCGCEHCCKRKKE